MRNITDIIEQYLKNILLESPDHAVEIQRNELADKFQCVPSQINYVISTRFTLEKGYMVQSKRGGGGYVRIQKVKFPETCNLKDHVFRKIGDEIDQEHAEGLIYQLEEAGIATRREAELCRAVVSREVLALKLPYRDRLRAAILKAMLISLLTTK